MSLLLMNQGLEFQRLTEEIFALQLEHDSQLHKDLDSLGQQKMFEVIQSIVDFLYITLKLEDERIMEMYARWNFQLLCPLMSNCTRERVRDILVNNYAMIWSCMEQTISTDTRQKLKQLLDCAIQATINEYDIDDLKQGQTGQYEKETKQYLNKLLQSDTKGAMSLIAMYVKDGIPLSDICVDIIAEAMRRVGDLWHQNQISVDLEHSCTAITQIAFSQLYPVIFGQERKDKSVLVACIGSELHELGARMVADLFEYNGWESIYLGAAVPVESLLSAVLEHQPDLVALSVTMPHHLLLCREAVEQLQNAAPEIKIAVGGNAFSDTDLWKNWHIDMYTQDARELIRWADEAV